MQTLDSLKRFVGMRPEPPPSILEVLQRTPLDRLDQTVARLKKRTPATDVRKAYVDLLGLAPLEHFGVLREVYMKHIAE